MEEKSLRNNRPKAWEDVGKRIKPLKPCPFCGSAVSTHISKRGIRFFDCYTCSASIAFMELDNEASQDAFNERFGVE